MFRKEDVVKNHSVHVRYRVSTLDAKNYPPEKLVESTMRQRLADEIMHSQMKRQRHEFFDEFSIDLYVFSPDEFWKIVSDYAFEMGFNRPGIERVV